MSKIPVKNPHKDPEKLNELLKKLSYLQIPPPEHYCPDCDNLMTGPKNNKCLNCYGLQKTYGIDGKIYNDVLKSQGGKCAICKTSDNGKDAYGNPKRLVVDHCHATGHVRGLLCSMCNQGLGFFKDDVGVMYIAAAYIIKHRNMHL